MEQEKVTAMLAGLKKLREPFPDHQISHLPKPTKRQTDLVKENVSNGIRCGKCGAWHHKDVVHIEYVGHAALTDRLLDADPTWNYEFISVGTDGLPVLDKDGGLWIKLTVCGVTRYGYGDAQDKTGPDASKERIGDALRNAAMRFGAALELWHKGVLHLDTEPPEDKGGETAPPEYLSDADFTAISKHKSKVANGSKSPNDLIAWVEAKGKLLTEDQKVEIASWAITIQGV